MFEDYQPTGRLLGGDSLAKLRRKKIAKWLFDNGGRGLLCYGNCGRGKSLICWKILPLLIHHYHRKVVSCYDSQQMNADIDEVKSKHLEDPMEYAVDNLQSAICC